MMSSIRYSKKESTRKRFICASNNDNTPLLPAKKIITIDVHVLANVISDIRRLLGSAGDMLLYYQGFSVGKCIFESLTHYYHGHIRSHHVAMTCLSDIFRRSGWGIINTTILNNNSTSRSTLPVIRIYENVECLLAPKRSKPNSQLARGVLAGFFSSLFNTKVYVEEKKCIAMGDPYCEFILLFDT